MNAPKYDPTITFGNLLTIAGGVVFALTIAVSLSAGYAAQSSEIKQVREQVRENQASIKEISEIKKDLAVIKQMIIADRENSKRVMDYLERGNGGHNR